MNCPTVLVTRGARVREIYDRLTSLGARVIIPAPGDDLRAAYDRASHLLTPGGADIDPALYGAVITWAAPLSPHRDEIEAQLVGWALAEAKPLLGICRGHQMIAAVAGGTLYQDLEAEAGVPHKLPAHRVRLDTRSRLGKLLGGWGHVNSYHHQAVATPPPGWRVVAEGFDGVVEAIEHPTLPVLSVQWHPESLHDAGAHRLFAHFLALSYLNRKEHPMCEEQPELFDTLETLPLFSGAPMRGDGAAFTPQPAPRQATLDCPICHGTGEVMDGDRRLRCTCPAGEPQGQHQKGDEA